MRDGSGDGSVSTGCTPSEVGVGDESRVLGRGEAVCGDSFSRDASPGEVDEQPLTRREAMRASKTVEYRDEEAGTRQNYRFR
jgi:hypothetical protein